MSKLQGSYAADDIVITKNAHEGQKVKLFEYCVENATDENYRHGPKEDLSKKNVFSAALLRE